MEERPTLSNNNNKRIGETGALRVFHVLCLANASSWDLYVFIDLLVCEYSAIFIHKTGNKKTVLPRLIKFFFFSVTTI